MAGTLQYYIDQAIDAAEYGHRVGIECAVGSMTHYSFSEESIVFDLRGKPWAQINKGMIESVVRQNTSKSFQDRVRFITEDD
jgi:hypothetical protein